MNRVKDKATPLLRRISVSKAESRWRATGAIDLHFHGAFGIDLMTADAAQLDRLSEQLFRKGISAFLPTTISAGVPETESSIERLGQWIRSQHEVGPEARRAFPLGIHLEGPFIAKGCCGAHPEKHLIPPSLELLRRWQKLSQGTLAKITLAPETAPWSEIHKILRWAARERICISIGHSRADAVLARKTFAAGASAVTHAWNAMPFHHRTPGILGEALGRGEIFVEIIPDNVHVSDTLVEWTLRLHPQGVCFVSDAVPAAHRRSWSSFGPIRVQVKDGAGRSENGGLAGGGLSLQEMAAGFWKRRVRSGGPSDSIAARDFLASLIVWPLLSLPGARQWTRALERQHRFEYRIGSGFDARSLDRDLNS
jgi:N-acetylglucosamine-6-phosphate deacetylase